MELKIIFLSQQHGEFSVEDFVSRAKQLIAERHQNAEKVFKLQQQE